MLYSFTGCESLTSLDLFSFDTEKVKYMNGLFNGCASLTYLDLSIDLSQFMCLLCQECFQVVKNYRI